MFLESDFKVCSFFKVLMAHQAMNANDKNNYPADAEINGRRGCLIVGVVSTTHDQ